MSAADRTAEHLKDAAESTAAEMKQAAESTAADLRQATEAKLDEGVRSIRDDVTGRGDDMADAARSAGQQFPAGSIEERAMQEVASRIDGALAHIRDKGFDELSADVATFARRNPLLFLGGAALAGFAAARVLKAETPEPAPAATDDPWSGHLAAPAVRTGEPQ
ncbi:hypothetical protein ACN2XU_18535 [Primorskyibacter sp. 2E107]|uniref:hypothetical protein n=1 Tax=Primorskyibacter sp. 2E107 TaxID=3403458 RepID=UPI003AF6788F